MSSHLLTHSRMTAAKTCLRRHKFLYEVGIRKSTYGQPLRMGTAFHLGLERWFLGDTPDMAIAKAVEGYSVVPAWAKSDEQVNDWIVECEIVARLLGGYFWRWADAKWQVVAVEIPFDLPIRNPETDAQTPCFRLAGKSDLLVKLEDGRSAIVEHKPGDDLSPDSDYWKRLRMDQQISTYFMANKADTIIYDAYKRPLIRPKKLSQSATKKLIDTGEYWAKPNDDAPEELIRTYSVRLGDDHLEVDGFASPLDKSGKQPTIRETVPMYGDRLTADIGSRPDFYFARVEIPRLEADIEEFRYELWQMQQLLRDCQRHNRWPRNTNACLHPYKCECWDLCIAGWAPSSPAPEGYEIVGNVHPEL